MTSVTTDRYLCYQSCPRSWRVFTQLSEYLETNKLLTNCQFGYRSKRSTESAATLFVDDIRKEVDKGNLVGAVFMDLSKAFDTVGHATLIEKLHSYGVNDSEGSWFIDYLFNRTQVVKVDQSHSCLLYTSPSPRDS